MSLPAPDFPLNRPVKSRWKKWALIVPALAILMVAAALPFQGWIDLVVRPLVVITLLFFIGTQADRRR
jgi:hypothetical protein